LFAGRFRRVRLRRVEKNRENEQDDFAKLKKIHPWKRARRRNVRTCAAGGRYGALSPVSAPLFKGHGWPTSPFNLYPSKGHYMWRDLERICFDLDLPFRRPQPFPQNSLLAARVALIGLSASWGEEFCRGVFRAEFGECRQIDNPTVIADILSQLHIESAPVLEAARTGNEQSRVAHANGRGRATRHLWCAEFHDSGR
jgi:2-hydroxychromene-2-carboxylate isomerase